MDLWASICNTNRVLQLRVDLEHTLFVSVILFLGVENYNVYRVWNMKTLQRLQSNVYRAFTERLENCNVTERLQSVYRAFGTEFGKLQRLQSVYRVLHGVIWNMKNCNVYREFAEWSTASRICLRRRDAVIITPICDAVIIIATPSL